MILQESAKIVSILADFKHNIIVRACAGSGKTRLLAAKCLMALLKMPQPSGIVAITFTEKATQELKSRIQGFVKTMAEAESERSLELDPGLPWPEIREALIKTGSWPASNNLWPKVKEKAAALYDKRFVAGAQIGTIHSFAKKLLDLYPMEALGGVLTHFDPSGEGLKELLRELSSPAVAMAARRLKEVPYGHVASFLEELLESAKRGFTAPNPENDPALFDAGLPFSKKFSELWPVLNRLIRSTLEASRDEGYLDYDLIVYWLKIFLENCPAAALEDIRGRITYLLLDELQDTDPVQLEIISRLAGLHGEGGPAPKAKLFMVGDPFQSIYAFRGACPELIFDSDTRRSFKEWSLTGNKRSGPRILDFINAASKDSLENYEIMTPPALKKIPIDNIFWHSAVERDLNQEKAAMPDDKRRGEAGHAAAAIAMLAERQGFSWKNFAVLLRKTTFGWIYKEELEKLGIPAALDISETHLIKTSSIVRDLYWLIHLYLDLDNPQAKAFFQYSPLNSPHTLSLPLDGGGQGGGEGSIFDKSFIENVRRLRLELGHNASVGVIVMRLGQIFRLDEHAAIRGGEEIAALEAVSAKAWAGQGDLGHLIGSLKRAFKSSTKDEQDEKRQAPWDKNAVRITTIHKSKGLGFPCVILAGLGDWKLRPAVSRLFWDPRSGQAAVAFKGGAGKDKFLGSNEARFKALKEASRKNLEAEERRILYVAMTRSEKTLVIMEPDLTGASSRSSPSAMIFKTLSKAKNLAEPLICPRCRENVAATGASGEGVRSSLVLQPHFSLSLEGRGQGEGDKGLLAMIPSPPPLSGGASPSRGEATKNAAVELVPSADGANEDLTPLPSTGEPPALIYASELESFSPSPSSSPHADILGQILHACLELMPWTAQPSLGQIKNCLKQSRRRLEQIHGPLPKGLENEAGKILQKFVRSALWKEIASKKLLGREVPAAYWKEPSLVTGRVDLLYEDKPGVIIVADYKTEAASALEYRSQGQHYFRSLEGLAERLGAEQMIFEVISLSGARRFRLKGSHAVAS
ncbi:MAG: UvrD-helicase domain-containing protein [Elusimicrobia bacterium]|nr:UvrD-helicase domain-containing protein [Elusimicrobiota bacterium]